MRGVGAALLGSPGSVKGSVAKNRAEIAQWSFHSCAISHGFIGCPRATHCRLAGRALQGQATLHRQTDVVLIKISEGLKLVTSDTY